MATGSVLAALAICALLMSAMFFLHIRNGTTGTATAHGRILPGLTLNVVGSDLIVTSIESDSEAARRGIAVGDDIVAIDGKSFHSLDQAEAYLIGVPRDEIVLELRRSGHERIVALDRAGGI